MFVTPISPSRLSALSQPDLTSYTGYPDPRLAPMPSHMAHSQAGMPVGESVHEILANRHRKFKVISR